MRYPIPDMPTGEHLEHCIEVEKSRFVAWLCHVPDPSAMDALVAEARRLHPNASHHCTAFIAGSPGEQHAIGFSDDGEPGGTAGRPMYQVLVGSGLGQVGCVVIRYFGGTKLGTGGLARAYAQAASEALSWLPRREEVERSAVHLKIDFAGEAEARGWLAERAIPVEGADYGADGVVLHVGWPRDTDVDFSPLAARLRGQIERLIIDQ